MTLRLLEHYYSVQGEGPRVGVPTQFVRFAGCNLRCALWPCDTPYAIDPKLFTKEQKEVTAEVLSAQISSMRQETGANNVCLTGGEPMLQKLTPLVHLVERVRGNGFRVEMFSNGTIRYPYEIESNVAIVMDWKLPGSGEVHNLPDRAGNYRRLITSMRGDHSVKFTVASMTDLEIARGINHDYHIRLPVYVGPVWGKMEPRDIVDFVRENKLPWRLNLQTHKYIWNPEARWT
jgi:7-carboxy-7-deazaguanine synthase